MEPTGTLRSCPSRANPFGRTGAAFESTAAHYGAHRPACAPGQLRDGLWAARPVLARAAGYRGSVFYQGIEIPESFILRSVGKRASGFTASRFRLG
jgi:hypothetical protein